MHFERSEICQESSGYWHFSLHSIQLAKRNINSSANGDDIGLRKYFLNVGTFAIAFALYILKHWKELISTYILYFTDHKLFLHIFCFALLYSLISTCVNGLSSRNGLLFEIYIFQSGFSFFFLPGSSSRMPRSTLSNAASPSQIVK